MKLRLRDFIPLITLYEAIQEDIDKLGEVYPWWPCKEGCSSCCNSMFLVSRFEWEYIRLALNSLPSHRKRYYVEEARKVMNEIYTDYGVISHWDKVVKHYLGKPLKCPFLLGDACAIYEFRPVVCRLYGYYFQNDEKAQLSYCCTKVRELLDERQKEGELRGPDFSVISKRMANTLSGDSKPIAGWLCT